MLLDFEPVPDPEDDLRAYATPVANKLQQKSAAIKAFLIGFTLGALSGGIAYLHRLSVFCASLAGLSLHQRLGKRVFPAYTSYTK